MESVSSISGLPVVALPQVAEARRPLLSDQDREVMKVAGRALAELAAAFLVMGAAVTFFVSLPGSVSFSAGMMIASVAQLVLRLGIYVCQRIGWLKTAQPPRGIHPHIVEDSSWRAQFAMVNLLGTAGPSIAIHEAGHALMAMAVLKDSNPQIFISPLKGGWTTINFVHLSRLGCMLGVRASMTLVFAGGLIASTVMAMAGMTLAHALRQSHPNISRFLELFSYAQLLNDILYGIASVIDPGVGEMSDHRHIQKLSGIHPLCMVAAMIALPAALRFALGRRNNDIPHPTTRIPSSAEGC